MIEPIEQRYQREQPEHEVSLMRWKQGPIIGERDSLESVDEIHRQAND